MWTDCIHRRGEKPYLPCRMTSRKTDWQHRRSVSERQRASQFLEKAPKYLHSFKSQRPSHKDVALPNASILMTLSRRTKPTHGREIQTPEKIAAWPQLCPMLRQKSALVHTPSLSQNNKQNDTAHIKQHAEMRNNKKCKKRKSNGCHLREGKQN